MPDYNQMLNDIEVHSAAGIVSYFDQGGHPNELHNGTPLFTTMVEMYLRSPRFSACVQAFIDRGLIFEDKALLAVFTCDTDELEKLIVADRTLTHKTYDLFNCTFTPLTGGTLLHFCAEYNSVACARILLRYGADVNSKAGTDEHGFGGHTPIFHTVNQVLNSSKEMLDLLLEHAPDLYITLKGLIWGKGYQWETFVPSVNPISYAMMGLLPQMHRKQIDVAETVALLIKHAYGMVYTLPNIPNAYLAD